MREAGIHEEVGSYGALCGSTDSREKLAGSAVADEDDGAIGRQEPELVSYRACVLVPEWLL
jgi:hypothetical protein